MLFRSARQDFGADNRLVTLLLTCFAVGVGAGSLLASRLLRGEVSARHVPAAVALLSLFVWAFAALASGGAASAWHTPGAMLASVPGVLALLCLVGAAVCGGVFSVPLFALLQERSEPARRARTVAANNVVNAAAMVAGAGVVSALAALGVSAPAILAVAALVNLGAAVLVCGLLPQDAWRALFRLYFRLFHRVEVSGLEHLEAAGESAVVAANHTSFLDGCLLGAHLPGRPVFAVDTHIARRWWARPFLAPVDVLTVDPANPLVVGVLLTAMLATTVMTLLTALAPAAVAGALVAITTTRLVITPMAGVTAVTALMAAAVIGVRTPRLGPWLTPSGKASNGFL